MKRCSQCGKFSDDDNLYCVDDGAVLIEAGSIAGERVVVDWNERVDEVPTQFVAVPKSQPQSPVARPDNSKFLYALVGALFAVVAVMGIYLLSNASRGDQPSTNAAQTTPVPGATPDPNNIGAANFSANSTRTASNAPANAVASAANTAANAAATAANAITNMPAANARGSSLSRRFNRSYSGTVGDNDVEMNLSKNGNSLGGRVRPMGSYADIYLDGSIDNSGEFVMEEKSDIGVVTGVYRGRINNDGSITGTWSKPDGDKARPIYLRKQ